MGLTIASVCCWSCGANEVNSHDVLLSNYKSTKAIIIERELNDITIMSFH